MTDDKHLYALTQGMPARSSLVLLDMGDIQFLLGEDLVSLAPINEVQPPSHELACGSLVFEGHQIDVFFFNRSMQLQSSVDSRCVAVAILAAGTQQFGLACVGVDKQVAPAPGFYPVPISMTSRKQPFTEFAVINHKAVGLASAPELMRVLRLRGAANVSPNLAASA